MTSRQDVELNFIEILIEVTGVEMKFFNLSLLAHSQEATNFEKMVVITFMGLAMITLSGSIKAHKASIVAESLPSSFLYCGRPRYDYSVKVWLRVHNEIGEYDHVDSIRVPSLEVASNVIDEIDRTLNNDNKITTEATEAVEQAIEKDYESSDSDESTSTE